MRISTYAVILAAVGASALASAAPPTARSLTTRKVKPWWSWSLQGSAEYDPSTRADIPAQADYSLDAGLKLGDRDSFHFVESATQFTVVDAQGPDNTPFQMDDALVVYQHVLSKNFYGFGISGGLSATLPVSTTSRRNNVISRPAVQLVISRNFFHKTLHFSYGPYYRYSVNKYTSTVDGTPLKENELGNKICVSQDLTDRWSIGLQATAAYYWFYRDQYASDVAQPRNGNYAYDLSTSYQLTNTFSPTIGISHSGNYVSAGRYEVDVYDPMATRYYLAMNFSF